MAPCALAVAQRALAVALLAAGAASWPIKRTINNVMACITRYDWPAGGQSDGLRRAAEWVDGLDPVHWPVFWLRNNGAWLQTDWNVAVDIPLWQNKAGCNGQSDGWDNGVPLQQMDDWSSYQRLMLSQDPYIWPGGHRLRNILGQGGACLTYSTSRFLKQEQLFFNLDLLAFPVQLNASAPAAITNVTLFYGSEGPVYVAPANASAPLNSLTLLLPATEPGVAWQLFVNGAAEPVSFVTGLANVSIGAPVDELLLVNQTWADAASGTAFALRSVAPEAGLAVPRAHYAAADWAADAAAAGNASTAEPFAANYTAGTTALARHLGAGVPRAPVATHAVALPAGMSGGFFFPNGQDAGAAKLYNTTPAGWAAQVAAAGLDWVVEQLPQALGSGGDGSDGYDAWAAALADAGVSVGFVPDSAYDRPFLAPEIAFYGAALPDYFLPLFRDVSLAGQRFRAYPNALGQSIGADNAGYVQYWVSPRAAWSCRARARRP